MRPTRRNDPHAAAVRAAPSVTFRRLIKTRPAAIEVAVEGHARDLRFQRAVERLHKLGPRILSEFLSQVAAERSIRTYLEDRISSFANLDPGALAALNGDRMPPTPIHVVGP